MAKKAYALDESSFRRLREMVSWWERWRHTLISLLTPGRIRRPIGSGGSKIRIAQVDSDATGGGHYNCTLQRIDATNWNTDSGSTVDDTSQSDSIIVCNLAEIGSGVHDLDANDLMFCWLEGDDEGNIRWVGLEVMGRHTFGEV